MTKLLLTEIERLGCYPCSKLTRRMPGQDGPGVSRKTIARWRTVGVRRGGHLIRLRAERLGGRDYFTCDDWVNDFLTAIRSVAPDSANRPRPQTARDREAARARQYLDQLWAPSPRPRAGRV